MSVNITRSIDNEFKFIQGTADEIMKWLTKKKELDRMILDFSMSTEEHREYLRALEDPSQWVLLTMKQGEAVRFEALLKEYNIRLAKADYINDSKTGNVSFLLRKSDYVKIEQHMNEESIEKEQDKDIGEIPGMEGGTGGDRDQEERD